MCMYCKLLEQNTCHSLCSVHLSFSLSTDWAYAQDKEDKASQGSSNEDPPSSKSDKEEVGPSYWSKLLAEKDELNLAGVLNVLDGVVDCPNRIVVSIAAAANVIDSNSAGPVRDL